MLNLCRLDLLCENKLSRKLVPATATRLTFTLASVSTKIITNFLSNINSTNFAYKNLYLDENFHP